MKIQVDRDKCTGLGVCESVAPGYFEVNDDGDLVMLRADVDDEQQAVEEAVAGCPQEALRLVGDDE